MKNKTQKLTFKEKLQNLPFKVKVILSFLITILFFVSIFLFLFVLYLFDLWTIFCIIVGIIIITGFSAIVYFNFFDD